MPFNIFDSFGKLLGPGDTVNPPADPNLPNPGLAQIPITERLKTDPTLQQALLMFGANALQPVDPRSQTTAGVLGNALAGSINFLNSQRSQQTQEKQAAEAGTREERKVGLLEGKRQDELSQYEGEKPLREAQVDLMKSQAEKNRRPDKAPAAAFENELVKQYAQALLTEDVTGVKYKGNPQLAFKDAVERIKKIGTGDDKAQEFLGDLYTKMAPGFGYMSPEDFQAAVGQAQEAMNIVYPAGSQGTGGEPVIDTQEEYDALKEGDWFIDKQDGRRYRKGAK